MRRTGRDEGWDAGAAVAATRGIPPGVVPELFFDLAFILALNRVSLALAAAVHHRVSWHRPAGLAAIAALALVGRGLPLLAGSAILSVLLILVAHAERLTPTRTGGIGRRPG
ncbi:hypothetical protein [Micromonospora maritima]|uniref:hypothetical protein n=1 Tax=Micromonospora maritima TaxID=986711 RepID=UPI00157E1345|nr:hypothetical protein [Micromonospora maritima]